MENIAYIALSKQMAMRRQMDLVANNLANMNTTSYRGEQMLFEEHLMSQGRERKASFVLDWGMMRSSKEGPMQTTGNPLDIAISGPAYLMVETPAGRRYTRDGHLKLDAQGQLTTGEGFTVLNTQNQPIRLDPQQGEVTITADGRINNRQGLVGQFALFEFANPQAMKKTGANLYATDQPTNPAKDSKLTQGALEGSNVEPITEMTLMVEVSRSYQGLQRLLDSDQERQRRMIERIAKVS